METLYAKLEDRDFRKLVRGEMAVVEGRCNGTAVAVHLILADFGFPRMLAYIDEAINDRDRRGG